MFGSGKIEKLSHCTKKNLVEKINNIFVEAGLTNCNNWFIYCTNELENTHDHPDSVGCAYYEDN